VAYGELVAMCEALDVVCLEEETDLHIFTDSMVTIHLVRLGMLRPWELKGREHEGIVTQLPRTIAARGTERGYTVHVYIHKVKAHTGVRGNELADHTAKLACTNPTPPGNRAATGKITVPKTYPFWVKTEGGGPLTASDEIKGEVRELRQNVITRGEQVDVWAAIPNGSEQGILALSNAFWGSGTLGAVRKCVLMARYGRLATRDNLHRWFKQKYPRTDCPLCGSCTYETPSHVLFECKHDTLHAQHIKRHD
jgi:ribonuclease HI